MSVLARTNRAAYKRLKTQGVKGVAKEEYAEYLRWSSGFSLSRAPAPAPSPSPAPAPKRKHREAKTTKGERQKAKDERAKADFERKGEGGAIQKASPLDYIRKNPRLRQTRRKSRRGLRGGKNFLNRVWKARKTQRAKNNQAGMTDEELLDRVIDFRR